jgi:hypothetical protein
MNKELIIIGIIGVIVVVGIITFIVMKDKNKSTIPPEKFDISVDPLTAGAYDYLNAVSCPERAPCTNRTQYGGLNAEYDEYVSVKDFIETYENNGDFSDPNLARVTAKRYCQMLYPNHIEYFTGCKGYSSFGQCEIGTKEEIRKMYPQTDFLKKR